MKTRSLLLTTTALLVINAASADFYGGQWLSGKNGWFFPIDEFRFYSSERPDTIGDATQTITTLNAILAGRGTDLYATVVPIRARLYADQLPDQFKLPVAIRQRYANALATFKVAGVRAPDLNTLFQNSPERLAQYPLYIRGDHHWSGPGGLLAAQTIAAQITGSGKVAGDDVVTSELVQGEPAVLPKAPIAADGQNAPAKQTEMYRPITVKSEGQGQTLLGDETFPIAVVGDSFSNGERDGTGLFAFASLIEHFTQRRVYNAAQPGKGPWPPMLDYLKSAGYQDSPPKVLIWEMWEAFLTGDGQGYPPPDFLRRAGPLVLGKCAAPKPTALSAVPLNLGNYLALSGLDPKNTYTIRYALKGQADTTMPLDVTENGTAYPFPGQVGMAAITVLNDKVPVQIQNVGLCNMPQTFVNTLAMNGKTIDLARNLGTNQLDLTGFYQSNDGLTSRWALTKTSTVSFISLTAAQGTLAIRAGSPFADQTIAVSINGEAASILKPDKDGNFALDRLVQVHPGMNTLTFSYAAWRTKNSETNSRVDKNDPRDLAISFRQLSLGVN